MHNENNKNLKPKNLKKSLSRLIKELNKYKILIIISLLLAVVGSILSIITPNKLSKLTDEITKGLIINKDNFKTLNEQIYFNYTNNDLKEIEIDNIKISINDQLEYLNIAKDIKQDDISDLYKKLNLMPETIKELVKPKMNLDKIKVISIFLAIIYILSALFTYIESISMTVVANKFAKNLREKISIKINKLPLKYFDKNKIGDVLSRVTNDVDTVSQTLNNSLASFVSALTLFIGTIIMMFVTNSLMAITAIISSLFGFIFMFIVLSKSQKYFIERQKELGNLNANIEEIYSNIAVVKKYNAKEETRANFNKINDKLFNSTRKSSFLSGLMPPMMMFVGNFGYVCVCIVGALLVINNKISFGVIVAFISYVRLFTSPLSQIAQTMSSFQQTVAASERVFELLDEEEMEKETNKKILEKEKVIGKLEFNDVCFTYDGNNTPTIKDFSVKIKPGQKVALVGPTGSGKTTMVNLLMKFYDINSGDIKIDDIKIKDGEEAMIIYSPFTHEMFTERKEVMNKICGIR